MLEAEEVVGEFGTFEELERVQQVCSKGIRKDKLPETRLRRKQVLDCGKPQEVLPFVSQEKDSGCFPKGHNRRF